MKLKPIQLRACFTGDFRKNPRTLYDDLRGDRKYWKGEATQDKPYLFVSTTGRQLCFVFGSRRVTTHGGTRFEAEQDLLDYRGCRIEGSTFSPIMIEDYARSCGLTLHLPTIKEWYEARQAERHG